MTRNINLMTFERVERAMLEGTPMWFMADGGRTEVSLVPKSIILFGKTGEGTFAAEDTSGTEFEITVAKDAVSLRKP